MTAQVALPSEKTTLRRRFRLAPATLAILGGLLQTTAARAQFPPDSFTNLRVLPKTISQRELLATMRGFTFALGVRCQHCHVGPTNAPLDSFDFASDEKRTKQTARLMLQMVAALNNDYLSRVPERPEPNVAVRCVTCHRGLARPTLIDDALNVALAEGGSDRAVQRYRELRKEYYGSGSYDFSEGTLNQFGVTLIRGGRAAAAVALLNLSADLHPESARPHFYLGEAYRSLGDTTNAVASYRRSLEIDPGQRFVQRLLDRLTTPRDQPVPANRAVQTTGDTQRHEAPSQGSMPARIRARAFLDGEPWGFATEVRLKSKTPT